MQSLLEWLGGDKGQLLTAGTAGAAVSAMMEWTGFLPAVRKIVVGAIAAYYISPLAAPFIGWLLDGISVPTENASGMSGFITGVLGIIIIETLTRAAQIKLRNLGAEPPVTPSTPPPGETRLPEVSACKTGDADSD